MAAIGIEISYLFPRPTVKGVEVVTSRHLVEFYRKLGRYVGSVPPSLQRIGRDDSTSGNVKVNTRDWRLAGGNQRILLESFTCTSCIDPTEGEASLIPQIY